MGFLIGEHPTTRYYKNLGLEYNVFGPWPVPSPVAAEKLPPIAIHLPKVEISEFRKTIVARYLKSVRWGWGKAARYAFKHPGLEEVTDHEFIQFLEDSPFSRFLNPCLDPQDEVRFREFLGK